MPQGPRVRPATARRPDAPVSLVSAARMGGNEPPAEAAGRDAPLRAFAGPWWANWWIVAAGAAAMLLVLGAAGFLYGLWLMIRAIGEALEPVIRLLAGV